MRVFSAAFTAAVVAALFVSGSAGAAPIPGATWTTTTYDIRSGDLGTPSLWIGTAGDPGSGLAALGCPFRPLDPRLEAQTSDLVVTTFGWTGPWREVIEDGVLVDYSRDVLIRARVTGTVEDAAGTSYHVAGMFTEETAERQVAWPTDLLYDGYGTVTFAGPGGTIVGSAELRVVQAPGEYSFQFSSLKTCRT